MKNSFLAFLLIFTVSAFAQKEHLKYVKITQKICLKKTGYQLVLNAVISDSRCPEGVTCLWAGEASAVISVYKDSKLVEDKTIVFSLKNEEDNNQWLAKYLPEKQRKIKNSNVFPYPKQGVTVAKKDYYIKIGYIK
ncbi:hypothetical protein [Flavobacterium sp. AED]|uniref:hypothetical protein n=1 Tax=Flavobacterium sp. AED TaxID=1423323 RepID=UPI00057FBD2B|nr:hypothetical protein [Flavobacterium sp. AED]KIA86880.1 hypothetical protein OA85_04410 [Flavobacterium sp. AED]